MYVCLRIYFIEVKFIMCIIDENKIYINVDFVVYEVNFFIEFFIILNIKFLVMCVVFFLMKLDVILWLRWFGELVVSGV